MIDPKLFDDDIDMWDQFDFDDDDIDILDRLFEEMIDEDEDDSNTSSSARKKVIPKGKFKDGMICAKCKEYYPYAVPNQNDGSMVCYKCRNNL